jgi:Tfp pilus assembly protein PilN
MTRSTQRFVLATGAVLIGAAIVLGLFFVTVPEANQRIMDLASGIVLGWGAMAMSYYFGTSESSAQKTEALAAAARDDEGGM